MKKLLFTLFAISSLLSTAQSQLGINYQSIIRNTSGTILASTPVTVEFKLYSTITLTNVVLYHETHSTTTNQFGMANLVIGQGTVVGGVVTFSNVPWPAGIAYEVYVNSNIVGSRMPFVSVPYAFAAAYAPAPSVTYSNNILSVGGNTATISSGTTLTAGTGINVSGNTISNTAPDQTVVLNAAGATTVTGTYPNFTINTPTTQTYAAGNGIDITGGVISNTAAAVTPTITGTGATTVNGTYPNLTINTPTTQVYTAGTGINISGTGVISNTLTSITPTITSTGIAVVTPTTGNNFNVSVPQPTLSYNTAGSVLSLTHDGITTTTVALTGTGSSTINMMGTGIASVSPTSGSAFTVSVASPTFTANGPTTITGSYPNLTINSTASPSTTLVQGTNVTLNQSGNTYTVNATPAITQTLVGTGISSVTTGANTFTINTPMPAYTSSTGVLSFGGTNTVVATPSLSIAGNVIRSGPASNTITIPSTVLTGTGTGIATVTTSTSNFTVNVPSPTYTAATGVLSFGGTNTVVVTPTLSLTGTTLTSGPSTNSVNLATLPGLWSTVSTTNIATTNSLSLVGVGTNTPTYKLDVYATGSVPATIHGYNSGATVSSTGVFGENPNNGIGVYGQSNTGAGVWGKSTTGAGIYGESTNGDGGKFILSSNTTTANAVNAQTNGTGVALYAKSYNATPLAAKFEGSTEILHTATAANPHINISSPAGSYGRVKFSNTGQATFFSTEVINDGSGNNEAYSISHFNGTNTKQVFLINGQRMAYINALNYPLATFHVMTSTATAQGGIASEGFAQAGQINLVRNNNAGAGARTAAIFGDELGRINFAGHDGTSFGDGAKIYARASENVTSTSKGTDLFFAVVPNTTMNNQDLIKLGNDGVVIVNPNNTFNKAALDIKGRLRIDSSLTMAGYNTPPAQSPGTEGRIYYDRTAQKFKVSENGNPYVDLIPGSGTSPWSQSGSNIFTTISTDKVGIGTNFPSSKLQVENTLAGDRALYLYQAPSTTDEALFIDNRGSQQAAIIENNNSSNTNVALLATSNGIGGAIRAQNTSTANTTDVLNVSQVGQGNASYFSVNNSGNFAKAIEAQHNGNGSAIGAANSGSGRAGEFAIQNAANNSSALYATTSGGGNAIYADNSNATNTSAVIQAVSNSSGVAYYGTNTNGSTAQFDGFGSSTTFNAINYNSGNAINASANSGSAINAVNSSSASPAMIVSNTGINDAARFTATQGKAIYATNNSTGGNSVVELASNGNGTAIQVYKNAGASGSVASFANFATSNGSDAVVISNAGAANSLYTAKPSGSTAGSVAKFDNLGTANGADAVMVTNNGAGAAIHAVSGPTVTGSTNVALWVESGHLKATGATPAVTSTVALLSSYSVIGNDVAGKISVTTVATSVGANQEMVKITFNKSYPSGVTPNIIITPSNAFAAGIQGYVSTVSNTGFSLFFNVATAAIARTYTFNYMIIE